MMKFAHTLLASVMLVAVACGGGSSNQPAETKPATATDTKPVTAEPAAPAPAAKPASADMTAEDAETVMKEFLGLLTAAADDVAAAGGDCAKVTTALNTWTDTNAARAKAIFQKLPQVVKHKPVVDKYGGQMTAIQNRFGQLVSGCQADEGTKAAAKRFLDALQGK